MNYCIEYTDSFKKYDEIAEIRIVVTKDSVSPLPFLSKYINHRIILDFETGVVSDYMLRSLANFRQEQPTANFACCVSYQEKYLAETFKENNFPFFFKEFVNNWDMLHTLKNIGVSDMYITNSLGFELDKVAQVLHSNDINIRVVPNLAQCSGDIDPIKTFFIRPEDIDLFSEYVDIFEFYGDRKKQYVYYDIYSKDKKWFGPLREIIFGFNSDLDSRFILPVFGARRIKCGKKCFKGSACAICDRVYSASKTLEEKGLLVKKE